MGCYDFEVEMKNINDLMEYLQLGQVIGTIAELYAYEKKVDVLRGTLM